MGHTLLSPQTSSKTGLFGPQPVSYLERPEPVPTGDRYVDRGTICDPKDPIHEDVWKHQLDEYCFMAPGQRMRQVEKFKGRVAAARDAYGRALDQARVDELLEKSSSGTWAFELFLDVIGLAIVPAITKAFQNVDASGPTAVAAGIEAAEAAAAARRTSEKRIEMLVRQAIISGKRSIPRPQEPSSEEKKAGLEYLRKVSREAQTAFQQLSEGVLADSTDPDLLMLTEAYGVENGHSAEDYKAHVDSMLQRFDASGVGKLGTHWNERHAEGLGEPWKADTKAFWVELPGAKRLALYRRGHREGLDPGDWDSSATHIVSADEAKQLQRRDLDEHPFTFVRYVPDDLEDVALKMHADVWGAEPGAHAAGGAEWAAVAGISR